MIPKDPVMLLSFINLKLRDFYKSRDRIPLRRSAESICMMERQRRALLSAGDADRNGFGDERGHRSF